MLRIAWATDIHLDCAEDAAVEAFLRRLEDAACDALLLGGDLTLAPELADRLAFLEGRISTPIYFVLGNHDYYGSSVAVVRETARRAQSESLRWLPDAGVVSLSDDVALVGHGGWGDARLGRFLESAVLLNDYLLIGDLRTAGAPSDEEQTDLLGGWKRREALRAELQRLGGDAAETLAPHLEGALSSHARVLVLTHVPPFQEACRYRGGPSPEDGLPGFVCKAMGDLLLEAAERHPDRDLLVLCGHTHDEADVSLRPNLRALAARARYGEPDFRVLEL